MTETACRLRYSRPALRRDYVRAGIGLAMCLGLMALVTPSGPAFWIVLGFCLIFLSFAAHTLAKHAMTIELDEQGLSYRLAGPGGMTLRAKLLEFGRIERFSLRYYGRRRDRGRGIVELSIRAGGASITIDQALEGFNEVVMRWHAAADSRGVALDPASTANLAALGLG